MPAFKFKRSNNNKRIHINWVPIEWRKKSKIDSNFNEILIGPFQSRYTLFSIELRGRARFIDSHFRMIELMSDERPPMVVS